MKITDIVNESTTAGAIATVSAPMTTQSRNPSIYGGKKVGNLLTGKKTKKPYANSLEEAPVFKDKNAVIDYFVSRAKKTGKVSPETAARQGAAAWERGYRGGPSQKSLPTPRPGGMSDIARGMNDDSDEEFIRTYGKSKDEMRSKLGDPEAKKTVHEAPSQKYEMRFENGKTQRFTAATPEEAKKKSKGLGATSLIKINADGMPKGKVEEAKLDEDDLILVPGQGHRLKTGFHAFDPDRAEHEGETLKNSLRTIMRNAKELHQRLENSDQFPEWVSEKIGTIKGMMTSVTEYLISSQEPAEGVIAGGAGNFEEAADPIAKRITAKKWGGDDMYSWAVLVDGKPAVTGLSKREVPHYKNMVLKKLQAKPHLTGTNIEEGEGLWANIHAKRERIKHGSGERMRKPGSKSAPSSQDFKDAAKEGIEEGFGRRIYRDLNTFANAAKEQGLRVVRANPEGQPRNDMNYSHHAVDDQGNIVGKFCDIKTVPQNSNGYIRTPKKVEEGVGEKIKGVIRREKAKDLPLVQTRRDYAMGKAGDAYNKGELRKGNQYSAWAERDRKKKNDPTTNPNGTYRTKTTDYKGK